METFSPSSDITEQLLHRYGNSAAPQHRHLCATAAATRSILQSESLPLTPLSYFAASISTLSDHAELDTEALAALSSFLSIVIPLIPEKSISSEKAKEAVEVLAQRISNCDGEGSMGNASARALIKCLGLLFGFCDLENWDSVNYGFHTLLDFALDKRPKVRKCAQDCVLTAFKSFKSSDVIKKSSKLVYSLLKDRMALAAEMSTLNAVDGSKEDDITTPPHQEVLHLMNVVKMVAPYLSAKVCDHLLVQSLKFLSPEFSPLTRHVLDTIGVLLETSKNEVIVSNIDSIITCLVQYTNLEGKNPVDTVLSAASLAKCTIDIARTSEVSGWITYLPSVIGPTASLLNSEATIALQASKILKELIEKSIDHKLLIAIKDHMEDEKATSNPESIAIEGVCAKFDGLINTVAAPNVHILEVISVLFLRLGEVSNIFMKSILRKLAEALNVSSDTASDMRNLQKCVGSAVVAMGPEKLLTLLPVSPSVKDMSYSIACLLPVLKEYVIGSSLRFFMEHIVPLEESLHLGSHKVLGQNLWTGNMWELLPAFCHYPTDLSKMFRALAKVLISCIKDSSRIEHVAIALQMLVKQNKGIISSDEGCEFFLTTPKLEKEETFMQEARHKHCYSKKTATKNLKTLASCSENLLQAFVDVMFEIYPEKHGYLKDAVGCLASITESSIVKDIFISSIKRLIVIDDSGEYGLQFHDRGSDDNTETSIASGGENEKRGLLLELTMSFVDGASEDLVDILFKVTKNLLEDSSEFGQSEAYYTMSRILERHPLFCSSRFAEVVDLLLKLNPPSDITSLKGRFACFQRLLTHAVKENLDEQDAKSFLVVNEIIITLKDSKEDGRKVAYDAFIEISATLQKSSCYSSNGPYHKLIAMVLGYLTGSSPHMKSGAISALSVLIYSDASICVSVPDLVPSVLPLLLNKAAEVVKAMLGFVKVMVSSLQAKELENFLPEIVNGILRYSSISRNHFRSKVIVILEIMIRKCGKEAIQSHTPHKYDGFLRSVLENRHGKSNSKNPGSNDVESKNSNASSKSKKKRENVDNIVPMKEEVDSSGSRKMRRQQRFRDYVEKDVPFHLSSVNRDPLKSVNHDSSAYLNKRKANQSPLQGSGGDRSRNFGQKTQFEPKVKRMKTTTTTKTEATAPKDKSYLNKHLSAKSSTKFKRVGKSRISNLKTSN